MVRQNDDLKLLANTIIFEDERFGHLSDCQICFLESDKKKRSQGMTCFADTEKTSDKVKAISGFDFIITFYADAMEDGISDIAMRCLMEHELMHVGWEEEDTDIVEGVKHKRYIVPHDTQDFRDMIDAYGFDWISK